MQPLSVGLGLDEKLHSGPTARINELKIFTLNQKDDSQLQHDLGLI
jgi:hypothetical protein